MSKVIFAYRLVSDSGFAPCVDNNILTLACCKGGQIRKGKNIMTGLRYHVGKHKEQNPGDEIYILGIYKNKLLYYALTTDVQKMTDYFSPEKKVEFGKRNDQIYNTENGFLNRNRLLPHIHKKGDPQNNRDINGVYVIISSVFTYYGSHAQDIPIEVLAVLPKARENKKYRENETEFNIINNYIKGIVLFKGIVGQPNDSLRLQKRGCR